MEKDRIAKELSVHTKDLRFLKKTTGSLKKTTGSLKKTTESLKKTTDYLKKTTAIHTKDLQSLKKVAATHTQKLESLEEIAKSQAKTLLNHEDKLAWLKENMFTRQEAGQLFEILDKHTVILERLDKERIFTNETIRRHDDQLEDHQLEINKVKEVLKIS